MSQLALFDDDVTADPVDDAARVRARVCHPSGTPRRPTVAYQGPDMTALELRDAVAALSHQDLVAVIMMLCSGVYPRIARDSVIAELARRAGSRPQPGTERTPS